MCFTNDDRLDELLRSLRNHGQGEDRYQNIRIGINGRLDTLQAAILLAKFDIFPAEIELRQKVAANYDNLLTGLVATPKIPDGSKSAWAQYSVLTADEDERTRYMARLKAAAIPTAIYYPRPLHLQQAFASLGHQEGDFPVSEACARRIFSLPMHPYLAPADQDRIASVMTGK
jgi:dTDP-4-amino-4,6-dideoxygalactose transaminase